MIIYKITNKINGKIYIGQRAKSSESFLDSHYYGSGILIKQAVDELGIDNFIREIIEVVDNITNLPLRERFWIAFYQSNLRSVGYNLSSGGDNAPGFKHGEETKRKIGLSSKGRVCSDDKKAKQSASMKKRYENPDNRKKTSEAMMGHEVSSERSFKISKTLKLRYLDSDFAEYMTNIRRQDVRTDEAKAKRAESLRTPEAREKMSKIKMGHKTSDETREKLSEAGKGRRLSPESRGKLSQTKKNQYKKSGERVRKSPYPKGKDHWCYGKSPSEETRRKISLAKKDKSYEDTMGKERAELAKKKMSEMYQGRKRDKETGKWLPREN